MDDDSKFSLRRNIIKHIVGYVMARFKFRLQKVLDHRIRIEDAKKQAFVRSRQVYLKEKEKLDALKTELDICNSKPVIYGSPYFYIAKYNYILLLDERIDDQEKVVAVRQEEMNAKKVEFESSQKDRKVIDKLKEKAAMDYNFEMDKLEQKQNDEFALYGYTRK